MQEQLSALFESLTGSTPQSVVKLPTSGSNRQYFRLEGAGKSAIGTIGTSIPENRAFCYLSNHLREKGIPVPAVFARSADDICYLQEDLGDSSLFDKRMDIPLLVRTIRLLPEIQMKGDEGLDYSACYPQPAFDERMIGFDLNYFKYCFLKLTGLEFNELTLDDEFRKMTDSLMGAGIRGFMYRDFQARNVIVKDGSPWFIDFQGGRRGPVWYDLASFVFQARADYSDETRKILIDNYMDSLSEFVDFDREAFLATLRHFVLFRTLQVLGAYGFRGLIERKPHFLQSIPFAMANLRKLLSEPFEEYPYLSSLLLQIAQKPEFCTKPEPSAEGKLNVRVFSFSYRKGIPDDLSGNGGGYVYDCRGIENPGRYERFRNSTGMDEDVIEFLNAQPDAEVLLRNIYSLADAHVQNYLKRGFTSLMFCCGCTGGQHRSVYCAQHLADYLRGKYPQVNVILCHREQQR